MTAKHPRGFTLFEALIAITIGITLLGVTLTIYLLAVNSLNRTQARAELTQNSRLILERIVRDLRQARDIATLLPAGEIELEDGHGAATLQYIRYYQTGTDLKRQLRRYYFSDAPSIFVPWNAEDNFGNAPQVSIVTDEVIGQYVSSINFSGADLVTITLTLNKSGITQVSRSAAYGRNL